MECCKAEPPAVHVAVQRLTYCTDEGSGTLRIGSGHCSYSISSFDLRVSLLILQLPAGVLACLVCVARYGEHAISLPACVLVCCAVWKGCAIIFHFLYVFLLFSFTQGPFSTCPLFPCLSIPSCSYPLTSPLHLFSSPHSS